MVLQAELSAEAEAHPGGGLVPGSPSLGHMLMESAKRLGIECVHGDEHMVATLNRIFGSGGPAIIGRKDAAAQGQF